MIFQIELVEDCPIGTDTSPDSTPRDVSSGPETWAKTKDKAASASQALRVGGPEEQPVAKPTSPSSPVSDAGAAPRETPADVIFKVSVSFSRPRLTLHVQGTRDVLLSFISDVLSGRLSPREETLEEFKARGGLVQHCPPRFAAGAPHQQNRKRIEELLVPSRPTLTRKDLASLTLDDILQTPPQAGRSDPSGRGSGEIPELESIAEQVPRLGWRDTLPHRKYCATDILRKKGRVENV